MDKVAASQVIEIEQQEFEASLDDKVCSLNSWQKHLIFLWQKLKSCSLSQVNRNTFLLVVAQNTFLFTPRN